MRMCVLTWSLLKLEFVLLLPLYLARSLRSLAMSRGRGSGGGGYGRGRGKASGPPFGMTWPEYMALKTEAVNRPSKLFPPMDIPLPMPFTKQEIRGHELGSGYRNKLRSTPYYITSPKPDRAIERFSDQYSDKKHVGSLTSIQTSR